MHPSPPSSLGSVQYNFPGILRGCLALGLAKITALSHNSLKNLFPISHLVKIFPMMAPLIISLLVGLSTVIQGGLNREISKQFGVAGATVINSVFVLIASIVVYLVLHETKILPFSQAGKLPSSLKEVNWWYPLVGFLGCSIVFGIPFGISRIGALKTITLMICSQVLCSLLWDLFLEKLPLSWPRVLGSILTIAGAALTCLR